MKKMMMTLALTLAIAMSATAMSYSEARREALFLADKMAYELNLTDEQYEAAYEANLDYLMAVNHRSHLYGSYWTRRNSILETILAPWQYAAYTTASYFYRPLYWASNTWRWRIYNRYDRNRYYKRRPAAYISYRGGRPVTYYTERRWVRPGRPMNYGQSKKYYKERAKSYRKMEKEYNKFERKMDKEYRKGNGRWGRHGKWDRD